MSYHFGELDYPKFCPKCKGLDLDGGMLDPLDDGTTIYRQYHCRKCDLEWAEYFNFSRWELVKDEG